MASYSSLSIEQVRPPQQPVTDFRPKPSSSSFPIEPLKLLEYLSCLQTDQTIPIHKINDVVIPILSHYLSECNPHLCSSESVDHRSPLQEKYDKIDEDLSHIKTTLERLKEWEHRLNTLTRDLMRCDWEALCSGEGTKSAEVQQTDKIPEVKEMVSALKSHISLPLETSLAPKSSDIPHLPIPEKSASILKCSEDFPKTDTIGNLKECYDALSLQQQQSLLYFSFFPENALIRKKVPTYLWMGEEFLPSTAAGGWEETADPLFKQLIENGFVEPVEEKVEGDFNVCSIKPDTRSALLKIAHTKGFFHCDSEGNPTNNSRRAWLEKTKEGSSQHLSKFSISKKLQTLFNINENCLDFPSRQWLSEMEDISVIHLGNWSSSSSTDKYIEAEHPHFLEYLRDAKHLRCLSLNGIYGITELPNSISKFDNLNVLDTKSCRDLEKLPEKIGSLGNLTHLDMSGCYQLDEMPEGLALLSELRVLKGFVICRPRKGTKQCTLGDLAKLGKLRKLSLYADKETTGQNGELNCLSEFKSLQILAISWIAPIPDPQSEPLNGKGVASPSLPTSLEKLDLRCWPLSRMPSWIKPRELNSLKKLYIRGGKLSGMQIMQAEASKPPQWMVKILRLKFLRELKMDWEDIEKSFPSLVYLEKVDCPQLSSFPSDGVQRFSNR